MIKAVGIIAKSHKLERIEIIKKLYHWLIDKEVQVFIDSETALRIDVPSNLSREDVAKNDLDLIIVLGGDGTLLSVARLVYDRDIPILGVNMGNLGFLTEVTMGEVLPVMEKLLAGKLYFEERILLEVSVIKQGDVKENYTVLNDVVFNKGVLSRLVDLKVHTNKQYVTSYRGDGLIISTPTGSTAYSLAAGGPILYPTIDALIVCPICPFSFANRPIVVPGNEVIEVQLESEHKDFYVTLDGQSGFEMKREYIVRIQRAQSRLKLIHLPEKNYYEVLRRKLKWGDR
jgi:NAD+ kinase